MQRRQPREQRRVSVTSMLADEAARAGLPDIQYEHVDGVFDLTWGHPDPSLLAIDSIGAAASSVLAGHGWQALTYGAPLGAAFTREAVAAHLTRTDAATEANDILIAAGSSGGLDLLLTVMAVPGDVMLVEQPTYFLALRMFADHGLRVIGLTSDDEGPSVNAVIEAAASARAQSRRTFLYLVPTFANPTGRCLPADRQRELIEVARDHDVLVIEDDVYRDTASSAPPSMWSLDHDAVARLGSFSKSLSPGLRVGFITAGESVLDRIGSCGVLDSGGGVNHFASMLVGELLHSGRFSEIARTGQQRYVERKTALTAALDPALFTFTVPSGGYFVWLRLPDGITSPEVVRVAHAHGVHVSDGRSFYVDHATHSATDSAVRVSFSMLEPTALARAAEQLNMAVAGLVG